MKTITQERLIETLKAIKGATFATIVTETDPRLRKTGNNLGPVRKASRVNVTLGFQYDKAVNRQRTREDGTADFEAAPRAWGQHITPMLIEHKGKLYLETKVERSFEATYLDTQGKVIAKDKVKPFLPNRSSNSRQKTDKEIIVRDYALNSIRSISLKGETYVVLTSMPVKAVA